MAPDLLKKVWQWHQASEQLAELRKLESDLRRQIFAAAFQEGEGTAYADLPDGYQLKGIGKLTRSLDERLVPTISERIPAMHFNRVFKQKVQLSTTEYKKLPPEVRDVVDEAILTKPGMPSLELIFPSAEDEE